MPTPLYHLCALTENGARMKLAAIIAACGAYLNAAFGEGVETLFVLLLLSWAFFFMDFILGTVRALLHKTWCIDRFWRAAGKAVVYVIYQGACLGFGMLLRVIWCGTTGTDLPDIGQMPITMGVFAFVAALMILRDFASIARHGSALGVRLPEWLQSYIDKLEDKMNTCPPTTLPEWGAEDHHDGDGSNRSQK
jgi:hypothetical protein